MSFRRLYRRLSRSGSVAFNSTHKRTKAKLSLVTLEDRVTPVRIPPAYNLLAVRAGNTAVTQISAIAQPAIVTTVTNYYPPSNFIINSDFASSGPKTTQQPLDSALAFLNSHQTEFGLVAGDLINPLVTGQYTDADTGISHVYLSQQVNGLPVVFTSFSIGIAANGSVISAGGGFVRGLNSKIAPTTNPSPRLSALDAVSYAAASLGITPTKAPTIETAAATPRDAWVIDAPGVSMAPITARLAYTPTPDGSAVLTWQLEIQTLDTLHWYDMTIDAQNGVVRSRVDWVDNDNYNVVSPPNESVQDGGFSIVTNPASTSASPFGWHDNNGAIGAEFQDTRGNNVLAQLDRDANNSPDTNPPRPNGGAALNFAGFAFDPTQAPTVLQNQNVAVVNLFAMNNFLHDVHYAYGFTEAAGNFQTNNYGNGGLGNDAVQADAQDGSGTNNANFGTPNDGSAPRMQMYIWTSANPDRDSDLDNGVITHEYGHGVSNRLTGGPANSSALDAQQSGGMGEGWGDFWAMMMTQRPTDLQSAGYGMATYVANQSQSGSGIRRFRYSYDMSINPLTYDAYGTSGTTSYGVSRSTQVHNTGEIWASTLWDLNWLLINKYGFDPNLATGWSPNPGPANAGNKLTLRLVMDALKLQPANPSFTQARDAIIAADIALNGGNDLFEIWSAFARRGLGQGASSGSSSSTATPTLSFTLPMLVASVGPATGAVVTTHPNSYTLNVTDAIDPATLDASDFLVNGLPATSVSYTPGATTATWTFAVDPITVDGAQTITIAANAFSRSSDLSGVSAFSSVFYSDPTPLLVTSITPANGSSVNAPLTTIDVNFNQAINPASVQTSDLSLGRGSVTGFSLLNGNTTVRFSVSNIVMEGTTAIFVAAGAFLDVQGSPNAVVDGGTVTFDYTTLAFPTPLTSRAPLGSLAYDGSFSNAAISLAGDTDSFTINLDANQALSVIVTPGFGLQPTISVTGPGTSQNASASSVGGTVRLNMIPITTAGTYTFTVGGVGSSTGLYTIQTVLNSATESESIGGGSNDSIGTAESLATSFVNLGGGLSSATVSGRSDVAGLLAEVEPNGATGTATAAGFYSTVPSNAQYQIALTGSLGSSSDLDYFNIGALQAGDVITITLSGAASGRGAASDPLVRLYRLGASSNIVNDDDSGPGFDAMIYRFTITTNDTYYIRASSANSSATVGSYQIAAFLENTSTSPNTGGSATTEIETNDTKTNATNVSSSWRSVKYLARASGTIDSGDTDFYSYQFTAGDVVTLIARSSSSLNPQAALVNSSGVVLATDDATSTLGGAGGLAAIYGYVIPTTDTYYFRVNGASSSTGSYTAEVTLSTPATLPLAAQGNDTYSLTLSAGQSLSAVVKGASPGLTIAILDSAGGVVANGVFGATNVDQSISAFSAPSSGNYFVRVSGEANIDYQLTVLTGGVFDAEANDGFATAQAMGDGRSVLGAISFGNEDWYQITLTAGSPITLTTSTPGGGSGEWTNTLDPAIFLYDPNNTQVGFDDNSGADGRNAMLIGSALMSGNYRIRVVGAGGSIGEYVLNAAVAAPPPTVASVVVNAGQEDMVQRSRVTSISVTFSTVVNFANPGDVAASFGLSRIGGGTVGDFTGSATTIGGVTVVTLTGFSGAETDFGSLADGVYVLTAASAQITDSSGQMLDGDGNGQAGGDYTLNGSQSNGLFRYFGDATGDGGIGGADFGFFRSAYGTSSGVSGYLDFFDFDGGGIGGADFGQFRQRYGTNLFA